MFSDPKFIGQSWDAATGIITGDSAHPEMVGKHVSEWPLGTQVLMSVITREEADDARRREVPQSVGEGGPGPGSEEPRQDV